jgi:hypothetical protein
MDLERKVYNNNVSENKTLEIEVLKEVIIKSKSKQLAKLDRIKKLQINNLEQLCSYDKQEVNSYHKVIFVIKNMNIYFQTVILMLTILILFQERLF